MIPLKVEPSATLALLEQVRQMRAAGKDVASFAAGEPDFPTPPLIIDAVVESLRSGNTKYVPTPGQKPLRDGIAEDYRTRMGAPWVQGDNVLVSAGAKQGLYLVLAALLEAGDEVLIPAPYWVSYPHLVHAAGGHVVMLQTQEKNSFFPTVEELEAQWTPQTKALVFASPGNPTGCMITKSALEKIVKWCVKRKVTLIFDEIYERLELGNIPHTSALALVDEAAAEYVVSVNAFSKSMSMTGWRVGYVVTAKKNIAALSPLHGQMLTCLPGFLQDAALVGLQHVNSFLPPMVASYRKRLDLMLAGLAKIPDIKALVPTGAFYVCVDVRAVMQKKEIADDIEFAEKLLQAERVVVPSGSTMGMPGWLRFSVATSEAEIQKGLERFARFCQ